MKYAVQQRVLRKTHSDSKYCAVLLQYMKEIACKLRSQALMLSLDDKCTIPLGEPELPQSTGVRPHHRSLGLIGTANVSLDHDFHTAGVVPPECVLVNILDNSRDSFYGGTIHVTVKDKVFQPSTTLRHTVEIVKIIRVQVT